METAHEHNGGLADARLCAELAGTVAPTGDLRCFGRVLAERARRLLAADAVGVLLADQNGRLTASGDPDELGCAALFRTQVEDGPSRECYRSGRAVAVSYLTALQRKWLVFASGMLHCGFMTADALPLGAPGMTTGAVTVFRVISAPLTSQQRQIQRAVLDLADVAVTTLALHRTVCSYAELADELHGALSDRAVIEQATGFVAAQYRISVEQAYRMLRAFCRTYHQPLRHIAREVVAGQVRLGDWDGSGLDRPPPR